MNDVNDKLISTLFTSRQMARSNITQMVDELISQLEQARAENAELRAALRRINLSLDDALKHFVQRCD